MTELKTLKECYMSDGRNYEQRLKEEAIKDLLNIYELENILKIKLNDKIINILNKYIMWKNNIKEEDLK